MSFSLYACKTSPFPSSDPAETALSWQEISRRWPAPRRDCTSSRPRRTDRRSAAASRRRRCASPNAHRRTGRRDRCLVVFRFADFARFRSEMTLSERCVVLARAGRSAATGAGRVPLRAHCVRATRHEAGAPNREEHRRPRRARGHARAPLGEIRGACAADSRKKARAVIDANLRALRSRTACERRAARSARSCSANARPVDVRQRSDRVRRAARRLQVLRGLSDHAVVGDPASALASGCRKIGGTCLQTEDELAAIGAVVGASFAGAKSMTATSGRACR